MLSRNSASRLDQSANHVLVSRRGSWIGMDRSGVVKVPRTPHAELLGVAAEKSPPL